jgi:hypothetical protein
MSKTGTIIIGKGTYHSILTSLLQKFAGSVILSSCGTFLTISGIVYYIIKDKDEII